MCRFKVFSDMRVIHRDLYSLQYKEYSDEHGVVNGFEGFTRNRLVSDTKLILLKSGNVVNVLRVSKHIPLSDVLRFIGIPFDSIEEEVIPPNCDDVNRITKFLIA